MLCTNLHLVEVMMSSFCNHPVGFWLFKFIWPGTYSTTSSPHQSRIIYKVRFSLFSLKYDAVLFVWFMILIVRSKEPSFALGFSDLRGPDHIYYMQDWFCGPTRCFNRIGTQLPSESNSKKGFGIFSVQCSESMLDYTITNCHNLSNLNFDLFLPQQL